MGAEESVNGGKFSLCGVLPRLLSKATCLLLTVFLFGSLASPAASLVVTNAAAEFDRANKLYEQGKFPEAAGAYEALVAVGASNASLWFNLGNAAYKSGQMGRAIVAYRMAERLTPRDPALRANLQFVRGKVYSDERTRVPTWKAAIRIATLNEWTALTAMLFWAWCAVLMTGEITRRRYTKTLLMGFGLLLFSGTATAIAASDLRTESEAIVVAEEVTARFGPLDESQAAFQLRDGAEVIVLDAKGGWLQVRDPEKRTGWMRRDEAVVLPSAFSPRSSSPRPQRTA
jgi:tetratricopeptide (TPR) repeat protein